MQCPAITSRISLPLSSGAAFEKRQQDCGAKRQSWNPADIQQQLEQLIMDIAYGINAGLNASLHCL